MGLMLIDVLDRLGACEDAKDWVGTKTLKEAWYTCEDMTWLIWFVGQLNFFRCISNKLFEKLEHEYGNINNMRKAISQSSLYRSYYFLRKTIEELEELQ